MCLGGNPYVFVGGHYRGTGVGKHPRGRRSYIRGYIHIHEDYGVSTALFEDPAPLRENTSVRQQIVAEVESAAVAHLPWGARELTKRARPPNVVKRRSFHSTSPWTPRKLLSIKGWMPHMMALFRPWRSSFAITCNATCLHCSVSHHTRRLVQNGWPTSSVLELRIFSMCASLVFAVRPCHGSFP